MCLAVIGLDAHPRYALVIAANRDEAHARPASPAAWWDEGWLAGRDLRGGGTWLGVDRRGRWAFLTNVREPGNKDPAAPTRGALVTEILGDPALPADSLARRKTDMARYNGFNLLAGTMAHGWWLSNRTGGPQALPRGVHAVSNAGLDTPWPKVVATRHAFANWCAAGGGDFDPLFAALASRAEAPDAALPQTGVSLEWERRLSAPFIVSAEYGTRCSTVVAISHEGQAIFMERSFDPLGAPAGSVEHRFTVVDAGGEASAR
ncbi:MAG: NRDE family protein [Betaproteobacteria bacterium]